MLGVKFRLPKKTCEELKDYFSLPNSNEITLHTFAVDKEGYRNLGVILQPKKPVDFTEDLLFECTDKFEERCKKVGFGLFTETDDWGDYTVSPDFIKPLLGQLKYKYQICWTRYDSRELCWKFPDRWWRNLGKKVWG